MFGRILALGALMSALAPAGLQAAPAAWRDHATGLAIGGFDPLAYYVDAKPRRGDSEFEYQWQGTVFRFVNPGNRAAFERDPQVYAPRFGGYDPVVLAKGLVVEGEPEIWAIRDQALYLFESRESLAEWARNPGAVLAKAAQNWPRLAATIPELPGN